MKRIFQGPLARMIRDEMVNGLFWHTSRGRPSTLHADKAA
jgi:hypothetical protein